MLYRAATSASVLMAVFAWTFPAQAFDDSKYPDLKGQWERRGTPNWQQILGKPPLTPEYQTIYDANRKDMNEGGPGDVPSWACIPQGMPMMMNVYDPMEIIVTPDITYVLISHINNSYRRIYTDGRDWPKEGDYELTYVGYSIGKWIDEDDDGKYDALEVETRLFKGPRTYDASGIPLDRDNGSVVKERFHLDRSDANILHNDITVVDRALTRPWSITKTVFRSKDPKPVWHTETCSEANSMVKIGNAAYFLSADGYLMPMKKNQPAPDLRYFKKK